MADSTGNRDSNNALYFIVGGLVVVVAVIAFLYFNGDLGGGSDTTNVTIEAPATPEAPAAPATPAPSTTTE